MLTPLYGHVPEVYFGNIHLGSKPPNTDAVLRTAKSVNARSLRTVHGTGGVIRMVIDLGAPCLFPVMVQTSLENPLSSVSEYAVKT